MLLRLLNKNVKKPLLLFSVGVLFAFSSLVYAPKKAEACCSCFDTTVTGELQSWILDVFLLTFVELQLMIGGASMVPPGIVTFASSPLGHRAWLQKSVWRGERIAPGLAPILGDGMRAMGDQLASIAMQQSMIIGQFLDAKHQLETQQVLQTLQARAHKDYHSSVGLCELSSNAKSLAASERKVEINTEIMSKRSNDRALGKAYSMAAFGDGADKEVRLRQFRTKFCDPQDHNNGLEYLCQHDLSNDSIETGELIGGQRPDRLNKDIDYTRSLDNPWTVNVDFSDGILTDHEEEILALSQNLYGHDVLPRIPADDLRTISASVLTGQQETYMDMRAITAKRNVAENSFHAVAAMKSAGAAGAKEFLVSVMDQLLAGGGAVQVGDASLLLGDNPGDPSKTDVEPSYYAQMEVLTKKLLQNPDFYTNLYDKPANVDRKKVALQAIGLMQKFDLFKSHLRNEANLSLLLELAVVDMQDEIENEVGKLTSGGSAPNSGINIPIPNLP